MQLKNSIKQLISFILPITVLIIVPFCIERDTTVKNLPALLIGLILMFIGLFIMVMTISAFIRIGNGTLAPWSPTKKLVTEGMYAHVRNPMISGVLIVLIGESVSLMSLNILIWALIFFGINTVFFLVYEEPNLEKRIGEEYRIYKRNVPRWIPNLKAFNQTNK